MPSVTLPSCPRYIPPPPTQLDLDFADLAIIDLSKAQTPEGRAELVPQIRDALRTNGFIYAINHGYTQAQRDRIFDIANVPFTAVPPEEMRIYTANIEKASYYAGYKPRGFWAMDTDNNVWDQIEQYAFNHNVTERPHPQALRPFMPELDAFARHNFFNILHPILRLIALGLELPEETLVEKHTFKGQSKTLMTFMKYYRRTEEEEEKSKNVWIKGHTDLGSVTVLWSQPVGGLQILSPDGKWRWVRHIDNALVINTGDMMEFFTGGFYKPTIHRVVKPPHDQSAYDRLGTFYFAAVDDDVTLLPLSHSPVLQRVGIERRYPDEDAPLAGAWRKERMISYGRVALKKGSENNTEEEVVEGIVVKHYN
ncbi:Clavaminate synthase-like protein [Imleria badia]|nr:Clavaminate synthase-like protein [Imleria badia]